MKIRDYSVLVLFNLPKSVAGAPEPGHESEVGVLAEVAAVSQALGKLNIQCRTAGIRTLRDLPELLMKAPETLVFNLVEGFQVRPEEASLVPAVCQAFAKGCTGGNTPALTMALNKWQAKGILTQAGLPCPAGTVVLPGQPVLRAAVPAGRVIVKPTASDASEGIDEHCVLDGADLPRIEEAVQRLHRQFGQPVLIEPFVGHRELNVSILQRGEDLQVLPLAEIDFSAFQVEKPRIVGYRAKWIAESFEYNNTPRIIPAPLPDEQAEKVREYARRAWQALGCHDCVRVDFRLTEEGEPIILEVNPNPDVSPGAGFAAALEAAQIPYEDFVAAVLSNALDRLHGLKVTPTVSAAKPRSLTDGSVTFRFTTGADRDPILELLKETNFFRPDEIEVAAQVLDEAIATGPTGHYQSFTAELDGKTAGWVCYGPTPCCLGTFDVYWLGVSPRCQGLGLGRALMEFAESGIRGGGGRLVIVETAGRAIYDSTRAFYQRIGYFEAARLAEFYASGDDKIVYMKKL